MSIAMRLSGPARRQQLLDAAKRLVGSRGLHAISIEAVAREAGISRPIVYAHFGDLSALMDALLERELARALAQLAAAVPATLAGADAGHRLLAGLGGYLDVVRADPVTWRLVLMPPEGAPPMLRERIANGRSVVVERLAGALALGARGAWESPDPELTARSLSAVADEAARLVLTDPREYPVDRLLRHAEWLLARIR